MKAQSLPSFNGRFTCNFVINIYKTLKIMIHILFYILATPFPFIMANVFYKFCGRYINSVTW
jgi:hypothetical protein